MEAVALALISAALGLVSWSAQQVLSRRDERRKHKEVLYKRLLDAIVDMGSLADAGAIVVESQRMWLYASDDVLKAVCNYLTYYSEKCQEETALPENVRDRIHYNDAMIRLAMRRDIRGRTKINRKWIVSKWSAVGAPSESIKAYRDRFGSGE